MTLSHIQNWKAWVEWDSLTAWEDRLSELADYHKIKGHCNVPGSTAKNSKLAGGSEPGNNTGCT
jgi:hypothetical protein